jgi:diamine N-acetyltransferase
MNVSWLQSDRLCLRPMEPEDLELLYTVENDTQLWDFSCTNVPYSRYALKQYIASTANDIYADHQLRLIVEHKATHETLGIADLANFDPLNLRAEIGLLIIGKYRRQGYGLEALRLLCLYASERLLIHQLYAYVADDNAACNALFDAMDFKLAALLPEWFHHACGYSNARLYTHIF